MDAEEVSPSPITDVEPGTVAEVTDAAVSSAEAAAAAIERAAGVNDDPAVALELEEAAVHAEKTAGRVGWLQTFVRRLFGSRR